MSSSLWFHLGLPMWPSGKQSACQCRRCRFDAWVGKNPGGGNGNPFQSSCLENPMDREAWWATVHEVAESWTLLKWLSMQACTVRARKHHQDLQSYFLRGWAGWTFLRFHGQLMAELGGVRRGHALEKQICLIHGFFLPPHIGASVMLKSICTTLWTQGSPE